MTWDGIERRKNVRLTDTERRAWFAALEAEISDEEVASRDIERMDLLDLIRNMNTRPVRTTR